MILARGSDRFGEETDAMLRERIKRSRELYRLGWIKLGQVEPFQPRQGPVMQTRGGAFIVALQQLCIEHGVYLDHEDAHGSALLDFNREPGLGLAFAYEEYDE